MKTITCIACPRGCSLSVGRDSDGIRVRGHRCRKGLEYGRSEAVESRRLLTTTVRTGHPESPMLPVRLSGDIPLADYPRYLKLISTVVFPGECVPGDVIESDIGGDGIDLLATGEACYGR